MNGKVVGILCLLSLTTMVYAQSPEIGQPRSSMEEPLSKKASKATGDVKSKIQKAQMRFIGTFESGYKDAGIYKMVDTSDDVICYVLMPDNSSNRMVDGKLIYEANNVGSISCVKGR